jgi:2-polyprenyl-3-methyl-5-hydroxy-6-metoxy-1,4-benzoquinol methylase
MKKYFSGLAHFSSFLWCLFPSRIRHLTITGLLVLESRGNPSVGLQRLFKLQDLLQWVINERAMAYGEGEHPKHRLLRYHDFFVERIPAGSRVLDIGCGHGLVSRSIATRVPESRVIGVELNPNNYRIACAGNILDNLSFILADARTDLPVGRFEVIVLSNVLEHVQERVSFLQDIISQANPSKVLIRVPLFERDWQIPLRKEIGVNYFSDPEHYVEHTLKELLTELIAAGLSVSEINTLWGEIWCSCTPL